MGVRLENLALEIIELTLLARNKAGVSQMLILKKADLKLKILKLFIRIAHDVGALRQSRYIQLEERLLEIGRMIGGWIKKNTKPTEVIGGP